jgi:inner membrane protein
MASLFSHAVAAAGIGVCFFGTRAPKRVYLTGALLAVLRDLDVVGFAFGIHYADFWGHRGFTHSFVFAAFLAAVAAVLFFREGAPPCSRVLLWSYFFLAAASHGLLDALTNGGLGVAFFSPFDTHRYFLPWQPIAVSPIGVTRFFTSRGLAVLRSELLYIWLPTLIVAALAIRLHRRQPEQV